MIQEQHRKVIDRLTKQFEPDNRFLALIVGGSVAKGTARGDSDVDIMLVVTDEEWKHRKQIKDYFYWDNECDYDGGYVDGKLSICNS